MEPKKRTCFHNEVGTEESWIRMAEVDVLFDGAGVSTRFAAINHVMPVGEWLRGVDAFSGTIVMLQRR